MFHYIGSANIAIQTTFQSIEPGEKSILYSNISGENLLNLNVFPVLKRRDFMVL